MHWQYRLKAATRDGFSLEQVVAADAYQRVALLQLRGEAVTAPMIRTGNWKEASYLGEEPYVSSFRLRAR